VKRFVLHGVVVAAIAISLVWAGPGPDSANAIQGGGIGGVPANPQEDNPRSKSIFVYTLDPGENTKDAVEVINNTSVPKNLLIYAVDSQVASGGGFACAQQAEAPIAAGTWINLSEDRVSLQPNSKKKVDFSLSVPERAPPGEQNGCIVIQDADSAPVDQGNGINLSFRSAIRVAITIPGEIEKDLDFTGFNLTELDERKLRLSAQLRNNGNVSLDTDVQTTMRTIFGNTVRSAGGEFPVLAGSQAEFNFEVDQPFWGGWYKARAMAEYNSDPKQAIGEGSSNETIYSEEKVIFVSPHPLALAIELAVLAAILGVIAFFRLRRRHYRQMHARSTTHTVKSGDTVNSLAKANKVSWKKIAKLNNLKAPYSLKPGSKLKIPPRKK
jgi:hypothetical protein